MGNASNPPRNKLKHQAMVAALRTVLTMRNRSPTSVSAEAGVSGSAVNDILNGRIPNPSYETLQSISEVLDVPIAVLIGEGDILLAPDVTELSVPVTGYAEDGAFVMPTTKRPKDLRPTVTLPVSDDRPLARGKYLALVIRGRTMDRATDWRIGPGCYAVLRDFRDACQAIVSGKIYAIRTRLPDGREEVTLRRVVRTRRAFELIAESSDRKVVKSISAPDDLDGDETKPIHLIGRLVRIVQVEN